MQRIHDAAGKAFEFFREPPGKYSAVELAAILYLSIPLLVFCVSFLAVPLAVICTAAIAFVLYRVIRQTELRGAPVLSDLVLVFIAAAWTVAAGVTTIGYQTFDWPKHYAIFDALNGRWPVVRESGLYLRYSLGFYLVPSLFSKVVGLPVAIATWSCLGLWIAFRLALPGSRPPVKQALLVATTLIFFSGLDYIGNALLDARLLAPWHLEWWPQFGQISSISTTLAWAPQHAVPTLIVGALYFRNMKSVRADGLIFTSLLFWSPLTAIGMLPFIAWRCFNNFGVLVRSADCMLIAPVSLVIALYLTKDSASLPSYPVWNSSLFTFNRLLLVYILDWGLIVAALIYAGRRWNDPMLVAAVVCLTVFPLYWFGGANDFMMRTTAPAVVILAAMCAQTMWEAPLARSLPLIMILTLGATTAIGELTRVVSQPAVAGYINWNIERAAPDAYAAQYLSQRPAVIRR